MISLTVNPRQLKKLREATGRAKKSFGRELAAAINDVSKKVKVKIGKDIRSVVTLKTAEAKKPIKIEAKATANRLTATVSLKKTPRLGLRHFGARQIKKGVSYKIAKQGARTLVTGAFQGPKPGVMNVRWKGNVFKRVGEARLPIRMLRGISAYGAYVGNKFRKPQVREIRRELKKQMKRRIKLNILRANGLAA